MISFLSRAVRITVVVLTGFCFAQPAFAVIRDGGIDPANLGKGEWIYSVKDATNRLGGHISSVTNEVSLFKYYKSIGVRYVIIKMGTGSTNYGGCYASPHQVTVKLCNIARTNGVWVFGYTRSYGSDIAGESALADSVFNNGADGFVFDAEAEWESSRAWIGTNGPALAWQLCSMVRSNWPTKFIGHAPFPVIYFHSSFPYKEFGYWCDAVMPQVYHLSSAGLKGSPSAVMNWMDVNYRTWQNSLVGTSSVINGQTIYWTNSIKPVVPVQDVYGEPGNASGRCNGTTSAYPDRDVMEFIDYADADPNTITAGGYKGINFWRADLHGVGQFAHIAAGTSGNFSNIVNNIVMDDASATKVGSWTAVKVFGSTTTTPTYYGATGTDINPFGTNYCTKGKGTGSAYMQFRPNILTPGDYNVYQWHVLRTDAATDVPFVINYNGGSTTVYANQQTNDGNWTLLGRFNFNAGTNATIRVMDNFSDPASVAVVDGLKLVFVPPTSVPTAPNGLTALALSSSQINLAWNDNSTNESNFIVSRGTVSGGPYTPIATINANSTNYSSTNLSGTTTYYFVVRATNSLGASANSTQASATTLPGATAPIINTQPQNQTVIAGNSATFSVNASGAPAPDYQWRFNSTNIPGATASAYTRVNVQPNDAGPYSVIVSNAFGTTNSANATLAVNFSLTANVSSGGNVAKNPDQSSYAPGSSVSLTATPSANFVFNGWSGDATGNSNPLNVSLTSNKTVTANFAPTELILDNTDPGVTFIGSWQTGTSSGDKFGVDYRFASSVSGGTSNVTYRPNISLPGYYDVYIWYPQGVNRAPDAPWTIVYNGGSTNVSVNQQSNGGQWNLIGAALPFLPGTNGYVRLSNNASPSVVLADAVRFVLVSALAAPDIIDEPQNLTARAGTNATFNVAATGSAPLSYQWRFKGTNIPTATSSAYTRFNIQTNDAGGYSVVVTNAAGFDASSNATLTVTLPTPPQFQSITRLSDGRMDLLINGETGISYSIDRTTNFTDWETLTNVVNTNGTIQFIDSSATNRDKGFYRARE